MSVQGRRCQLVAIGCSRSAPKLSKSAPPRAKVVYDPKLNVVKNVLGTHSVVSRIQGVQLRAKREIRIAARFKDAPADFLRMIAVHELAHLKEREHGRAFYGLCMHMEPDYHQLEFDLRLWLTAQELSAKIGAAPAVDALQPGVAGTHRRSPLPLRHLTVPEIPR